MKKKQEELKVFESDGEFDYASFEREAISGLLSGKGLLGSEGVLTGLVQRLINSALKGEMRAHMESEKAKGVINRLNGHVSKGVQTDLGEVEIQTPRDRNGSFSPQLVGKWERHLGSGVEQQILSLYALGNSISDIQHQLHQTYGLSYSSGGISSITEEVWGEVVSWQQRVLLSFYSVIFLDGQYFKTREEGKMATKVIYTVYGIDAEGGRDVLGIYIKGAESSNNWGLVLEDLKKRGVEDVLFFCVDGLSGFSESILSVFPQSCVQRCMVHMVRSSTKFVAQKDMRAVCADLKAIYTAVDEAQAGVALEAFKLKWDKKHPQISKAWQENWDELFLFMEFGPHIRRMIYTTNSVEALHRQIRKVTKTKGGWVNDKALLKQIYLVLFYGRKGWDNNVRNWVDISKELTQRYGTRYSKHNP
jgi:transposase-like protein